MIEVNELQKRRVIGKLQKHLGALVGKRVALLGPGLQAEHRRHARGLLARARARLQADGARVAAYDPVAEEQARKLVSGVDFADSRAGARSRTPTRSCS